MHYLYSLRLILKKSQQKESYTDMVEELCEANMEHNSSQKGVHNEERKLKCVGHQVIRSEN